MRIPYKKVTEKEFRSKLVLLNPYLGNVDYVTGIGRSGSLAAVYASYYLRVPFFIHSMAPKEKHGLIVDTTTQTGKTLRELKRQLPNTDTVVFFKEPPSLRFWYEVREKSCPHRRRIPIPSYLEEVFLSLLLPAIFIWEQTQLLIKRCQYSANRFVTIAAEYRKPLIIKYRARSSVGRAFDF